MLKKSKELLTIILGSAIVAFAVYNIHSKTSLAEGGQLGVELLVYNLLHISPSITSFVIDFIFYLIGVLFLGKKFAINAVIGTLSFSLFYLLFELLNLPFYLPNNMIIIALEGGILVGVGCGLVVKNYGACGGDDSLALVIRKITKLPLTICYFVMDIVILLISLVYIPLNVIIYSLITALISSIIIGFISER